MLKEHAKFFKSLLFISDLFILSLTWTLSYLLRFSTSLIRPPLLGIPPFSTYVEFLFLLWVIWGWISRKINLYQPRRTEQFFKEILDIMKGVTLTCLILIGMIYLLKRFEFSRLAFFYFWVMSPLGLLSIRFVARKALKIIRRKGRNMRFAVIAGTGDLGHRILEKIELLPELGIQVIGFLTRDAERVGGYIKNIPIIGAYEDFDKICIKRRIDIFFIGLPINEYEYLENLIRKLRDRISDIKVVPGAYEYLSLRGGIDELDGLPIVSLQSSPLYGWNSVFKRVFDLTLGTLVLVMTSPIMFVISVLIKWTSDGPILYKQERVGMDGHPFKMLKFRTMKVDAEKGIPVWTKENDPRRTNIGSFLRKSSLDELPQLFNVIKGEMSLVGPRPERPFFVEEFRTLIPSYMLRHKIKAGMTGWAQVNGWRGDTSIERRIEHDLYYIQNWSIGFDLRIIMMTLWTGSFGKSAY
jgi:Undecaprenyl-phosphate glucose phosphotransferase